MRPARVVLTTALAAGLLAAPAAVAAASGSGAIVTTGEFRTLPGGAALGYEVAGHATMVRRAGGGGVTTVAVHASGLDPDTFYPTHVHDQPCSSSPPGGGHYQHEVGGAVDAVNEIWPAFTTNPAGVGHGTATHGHVARPDARAIVIHHPLDTSIRLACLDLG